MTDAFDHVRHPESGSERETAAQAVVVRAARAGDAPALHRLQSEAMRQYAVHAGLDPETAPLDSLRETVADVEAAIAAGLVLIACRPYRNHEPLASLRLRSEGRDLWLTRFVVSPQLQARGVGRRLFQAAVEVAGQRGATRILLHTALSNPISCGFYRALGFELVSSSEERGYPRGRFVYTL